MNQTTKTTNLTPEDHRAIANAVVNKLLGYALVGFALWATYTIVNAAAEWLTRL